MTALRLICTYYIHTYKHEEYQQYANNNTHYTVGPFLKEI